MGVTGLLPTLKSIQTPKRLEAYRGKTLAVDTYGWLHRALVSCARELCLDLPTRNYITSVENKVKMLRHFGVEPYLVFDGAPLPTKADTAAERRQRRDDARKKADELTRSGNSKLAWKEFMKAAGVTSQMAKSIMLELDRMGVKYVVAPYEADPQMVYLEKVGLVDGILSEDSDLFIFGCTRLITKLDDYSNCVEICRHDFGAAGVPGLHNFTAQQLRLVAMLSGCDYTKGVPGVGIKTAFTLVRKYNDLDRIVTVLRMEGKTVPDTFLDEVRHADLAFQYQKVFDPRTQTVVPLNEYPAESLDMAVVERCCGHTVDHQVQVRICRGHIHPMTHEQLYSREQSLTVLGSKSISVASKPKPDPKRTIDRFFKSSSFTAVQLKTPREVTHPREKVSPISKRIKKINEGESTASSKFFSKPPPTLAFPKLDPEDVTGDSDIPDFSSPVKTDTKNVLDSLTDDDEEVSGTEKRLSGIELDEDDDDVIDESPVKTRQPLAPSLRMNTSEFISSSDELRKSLQDFRCDSTYVKKPSFGEKRGSGPKKASRPAPSSKPEPKASKSPEELIMDIKFSSDSDTSFETAAVERKPSPARSGSSFLAKFAFKG